MKRPRNAHRFQERYGPWALVTGAALGLGAAFSAECAARGLSVVLVDRLATEVHEEARRIAMVHGVETRAVVCDLAQPDLWASVGPAIANLEIGLVVHNAGLGPVARFFDLPLHAHQEMLAVNCGSPLALTYHLGGAMAARGRGGLVFVSSLSALQGTALVASYAATKAWNLIFGESLSAELGPLGVDVLAVPLGATDTPGWEASQPDRRSLVALGVLSPRHAAESALDALGHRSICIPGLTNRLAAAVTSRLLPRPLATALLSRAMSRLYPGK